MPKSDYPSEFLQRMQVLMGADYEAFIAALDLPPITAIRTHPIKYNPQLHQLPFGDLVSWCEAGHYLTERPSFTFDPVFHAGGYYVQESSSMAIEQAYRTISTNNSHPLRVLDLCAAPGGKSTHLLSLLPPDSLLVCNEVIPTRNRTLQHNMAAWGYENVIITQNKPEDFARLGSFFDLILIDAPCSGEGLFRRDRAATAHWSEANVEMCSHRQRDILAAILPALRSGGHTIYSTCTFEPEENLQQITSLVNNFQMESNPIFTDTYNNQITRIEEGGAIGYSFYPHRTRGEGFFISLLGKMEDHPTIKPSTMKRSKPDPTPVALSDYISQLEAYTTVQRDGYIHLIPTIHFADYLHLSSHLYLRNAGLMAGELKGRDFIPAHGLAMSNALRSDVPHIEIDREVAIQYLRGENIRLTTNLTGWVCMRYQQLPIGWVKAMPNRTNNYYPTELRIKKQL